MRITELENSTKITEYIENVRSHKNVSVFGLNKGEKLYLANIIDKKVVYIVNSAESCEEYSNYFKKMGKKVATILNANTNYLYHTKEFGNMQQQRQESLYSMISNNVDVLVLNAEVLNEKFVSPQTFKRNILTFSVNQDISPDDLCALLSKVGYIRVQQVEMGGQFARRGDVVDIFPINSQLPYRLYYFDTVIEKIKSFNVLSQYGIDEVENLELCPNGYDVTPEECSKIANSIEASVDRAIKRVRLVSNPHEFLANLSNLNVTKEAINTGISLSTWGYFSAWCEGVSILDYMPDSVVFVDQPKQVYKSLVESQTRLNDSIQDAINTGMLLDKHIGVLNDMDDILRALKQHTNVAYQNILTANNLFEAQSVISMDCMSVPDVRGNWEQVTVELDRLMQDGYKIILSCADANDAVAIDETLTKLGKKVKNVHKEQEIRQDAYNVMIAKYQYGFCFVDTKIMMIGREQLNIRKPKKKTSTRNNKKLQEEFCIPSVGEYVVHDVHGIGICEGVKQLTINNAVRDYLVISYKNNDKLYVPTEQFDMLSKYVGADKTPTLNVLLYLPSCIKARSKS